MRFPCKVVFCGPLGLGVKPSIVLLRPRSQAGIPASRALLSLTARCPTRSRHLAHGLPGWVEAAFHLIAEVMPKCNSSELIIAPSSDNECSLPRGCSCICKTFGVRAPFPCAVFAQLMWLRLCCDVALQIMLIK